MALAKVLNFFCNTHFQDKLQVETDTFLTNTVREFSLYKSTTRDVINLSRLHGGMVLALNTFLLYIIVPGLHLSLKC